MPSAIVTLILAASLLPGFVRAADTAPRPAEPGWVQLFNGVDLAGWETWLAKPAGADAPLGLNHDTLGVFTVADGCIHISGEVFGGLTSLGSYADFHLRLQQKWGTRRWPPRQDKVRDSGVLYYCTGPHGAFWDAWMSCLECQVQEGETGDLYPLAGPVVDIAAVVGPFADAASGTRKTGPVYTPGAPLMTAVKGRVVRCATSERPSGEWNTIEIVCRHGTCTHIVNGVTVLVLTDPRHLVDGVMTPLREGRLQIQSEGAEVWYRKVEIRTLD